MSAAFHRRDHRRRDGRLVRLYGTRPQTQDPLPEPEGDTAPAQAGRLIHHPLRSEPVVLSPARQNRTYKPPADLDPLAPSAPGRATEIPFADFEIAVFDNRFPAFAPGEDPAAAVGHCEVVVYTPDYTGSLATLSAQRRRLLVDVWVDRYKELLARGDFAYVLPFENRGEEVGVTLHHPHGQIYAMGFIPPVQAEALAGFQGGFDLCADAAQAGPRIVEQDAHLITYAPSFSRFPYETWIVPRRALPGPWAMDDDEKDALAHHLGALTRRYDALFERPMPMILSLHAAPKGHEAVWQFHVQAYPFLRSAEKLKYLAGIEQAAGLMLLDVAPEDAAAALRAW